mgnify:CR=1 FL=1
MLRMAMLALLWAAPLLVAQTDAIPWRTDPRQAVTEAQRSGRPLMVYVLAGNKDRDNDLEREHRRALSDPRVVNQARQFVPLRLSRSVHRDVLPDFKLPQSANMQMSFLTPDGELLGDLGAGGIGQPDSLARKLALVMNVYRSKLLETRIKPVLSAPAPSAAELQQALQLVVEFRIAAADVELIKVLDERQVEAGARSNIYETLATLSTPKAVAKLLELSRSGDARATQALDKCTPAGAELILAELHADAEPFEYALYKSVTRICNVRNVKPQRYFEKASVERRQEELDRITPLVRSAAQRWRELNDEPR